MQLFQQQYKIFGSFGATMRNIRDGLDKDGGRHDAGDRHRSARSTEFERGLERLESRQVFGKSHRDGSDASRSLSEGSGFAVPSRMPAMRSLVALAVGLLKMLRWTDPDTHVGFRRLADAHGRAGAAANTASAATI